jgi:preprotein translocase subunit SecF
MIYEKYDKFWKVWFFVPWILFTLSVAILLIHIITTGSVIGADVDISGGNRITMEIEKAVDVSKLQNVLPYASLRVVSGLRNELIVETAPDVDVNKVLNDLASFGLTGNYDVTTVGPVLGDIFWKQAELAIITAFILMSMVVFILFRAPVPSGMVILSVIINFVITIAISNIIGIKLSLPVLAALLMIIGYSVDTDILLTTELLKVREREMSESIKIAMKTGLTMSLTTLAALSALFFISGTYVLQQISTVLIIGVGMDIIITWMGNANMLRFWLIRRGMHR